MPPFSTRHRNLRGITWLMLALPCFQSMNVMLRHVAADLPPVETMFFRNLFGFIILLPLLLRNPAALRTRQLGMNALRGLTHLGGMVGWVYALTLIPLATAAALVFSTPIFVAVGAMLFFGERPGVQRWTAIGLGLVGVLIIMQPGVEAISLGALVVLGASVFQGAAKMMVKVIVRTDSTMSAVFHLNLQMAIFGLVPTIIFWRTPHPRAPRLVRTDGGGGSGRPLLVDPSDRARGLHRPSAVRVRAARVGGPPRICVLRRDSGQPRAAGRSRHHRGDELDGAPRGAARQTLALSRSTLGDTPHNGGARIIRRYSRDACVPVDTGDDTRYRLRGIDARVIRDGCVVVNQSGSQHSSTHAGVARRRARNVDRCTP